jgi:hypothetical protein
MVGDLSGGRHSPDLIAENLNGHLLLLARFKQSRIRMVAKYASRGEAQAFSFVIEWVASRWH